MVDGKVLLARYLWWFATIGDMKSGLHKPVGRSAETMVSKLSGWIPRGLKLPNGRVDYFAVGLAALFCVTNLAAVLSHVMWRDEWAALQYARWVPSLGELFKAIAHQGHAAGWYVVSWAITQFGFYPTLTKIGHVLISTTTVFLIARHSPFTRGQKFMLAFSYYVFFEYGTIVRDYAMMLLLIVIACILVSSRVRRPIEFGCTLAVLFQTNSYGALQGLALGGAFLFDIWRDRKHAVGTFPWASYIAGGVIASAGLVGSYALAAPPPDWWGSVLGVPLPTEPYLQRLYMSLAFPWRGCVPIPLFGTWNSNFLDPWPWLQILLGLLMVAFVVISLHRSPTALVFFGLGLLAVGGWQCHLPWVALRYNGSYFLVLMVAMWLVGTTAPASPIYRPAGVTRRLLGFRSPFFTALLFTHVIAAGMLVAEEHAVPFSGGREAARLIREKAPGLPLIGDPDYAVFPVAGELDTKIYIASRREYNGYLVFDRKRRPAPLSADELSERIEEFMRSEKRDVILVVNYHLQVPPDVGELLGTVNAMTDEKYLVFRLHYRGQ